MTDGGTCTFQGQELQQDWALVADMLPQGWQDKAKELGALQRTRGFKDASTLLRIMFIHLAQGQALRETAVQAKLAGLADVSDVAILKRLNACGAWFEWMANGLGQCLLDMTNPSGQPASPQRIHTERLVPFSAYCPGADTSVQANTASAESTKLRLRIVDGTTVKEPGPTGSLWRLHYSVGLPALHCDEVVMSGKRDGESFRRFAIHAGDVMVADRGYAHPAGIAHVVDAQGHVIVRMNMVTLPLCQRDGSPFDMLAHCNNLPVGGVGDWPVTVRAGKQLIEGRFCAVRKSEAAAAVSRYKASQGARKNTQGIRPETLEAASYVMIFTTLGQQYSAQHISQMYRARWQIELTFKRLKSLLGLGHLKKHSSKAALAWLQGKLLVAFLIEYMLAKAEHFSPWGYEFKDQ